MKCKYCDSSKVVKKGVRKLKNCEKQVFLCALCGKRFSLGVKKQFSDEVILDSVCFYNQGVSYSDVCNLIRKKYRLEVSVSSVERWVKEYGLGYLKIRDKFIDDVLVVGKMFKHSGLIYVFKYHKGKLKFCKFKGLKKFIVGVSKGVDNKMFDVKNLRCSGLKNKMSVEVRSFESKFNKVLGDVLALVKDNKKRHSIVEKFLLSCDRDTIAVEVPIWYWDKEKGGVCGHIDILQIRYGKIYIMDYKPNASKENRDKVISQLYGYAVGLGFRAGLSLKDIRCGWFDEKGVFVFDADKVRVW